MQKFVTKIDASRNRYTLIVSHEKKIFIADYNNTLDYSDYITISKKDYSKIKNDLLTAGYKDLDSIKQVDRDPYKAQIIAAAIENMKTDQYNITRLKNDNGHAINIDPPALELLLNYYK